jgi:DNA-binding MarR family transcriptional regulator
MLLSKEIAVELNLTGCKLKQYIAAMLRKQDVPLTPEQFLLIDLLWNQGEMSQQQLADRMQKDKNSVTKLVDAIERKGFVIRKQNSSDRRSNTIVLAEKAELLKNEAKQKGISILDNMLEGITEEELRSFLGILHKLNSNMTVMMPKVVGESIDK